MYTLVSLLYTYVCMYMYLLLVMVAGMRRRDDATIKKKSCLVLLWSQLFVVVVVVVLPPALCLLCISFTHIARLQQLLKSVSTLLLSSY